MERIVGTTTKHKESKNHARAVKHNDENDSIHAQSKSKSKRKNIQKLEYIRMKKTNRNLFRFLKLNFS